MMKLVIEGESIVEIQAKILEAAEDIKGHAAPERITQPVDAPVEPETTGNVEADLAVEPAKKPRGRKPKETAADLSANTLAERPANSRPHTSAVEQVDPKLDNFKANFSSTIFLLLQQDKVDQKYITDKVAYYGLKNILEMKDDQKALDHFYLTLVSEGRI